MDAMGLWYLLCAMVQGGSADGDDANYCSDGYSATLKLFRCLESSCQFMYD